MNYHLNVERAARRSFIEKNIGYGEPVATTFFISKTSKKERINVLSDTGIITIYTKDWKPVTIYIANFSEACKIYEKAHGSAVPRYLVEKFRTAQQYKEFEP